MVWVAGNAGVIAWMNALDAERAAWTAFTPALSQGVGVAISGNVSHWAKIGKIVVAKYQLTAAGAGTAANAVALTLPTAAVSTTAVQSSGVIVIQDLTGASTNYWLMPTAGSTGSFTMTGTTAGAIFGASPAVTLASGDNINGTLVYEAA